MIRCGILLEKFSYFNAKSIIDSKDINDVEVFNKVVN